MGTYPAEVKATVVMSEVEFAKCECCGLREECTPEYIDRVRERHHGFWICGLCAEAVQDEIRRADRLISTEEAIDRHMKFSRNFRSAAERPDDSAELLITAVRQLLRRGLYSPRSLRSTPASPRRSPEDVGGSSVRRLSLTRSGSCFPAIAG